MSHQGQPSTPISQLKCGPVTWTPSSPEIHHRITESIPSSPLPSSSFDLNEKGKEKNENDTDDQSKTILKSHHIIIKEGGITEKEEGELDDGHDGHDGDEYEKNASLAGIGAVGISRMDGLFSIDDDDPKNGEEGVDFDPSTQFQDDDSEWDEDLLAPLPNMNSSDEYSSLLQRHSAKWIGPRIRRLSEAGKVSHTIFLFALILVFIFFFFCFNLLLSQKFINSILYFPPFL